MHRPYCIWHGSLPAVLFTVTEWLPIRKLQLFRKSSQDSDSTTSVESPTDFSSPDPFLATTTVNPFDEGYVFQLLYNNILYIWESSTKSPQVITNWYVSSDMTLNLLLKKSNSRPNLFLTCLIVQPHNFLQSEEISWVAHKFILFLF